MFSFTAKNLIRDDFSKSVWFGVPKPFLPSDSQVIPPVPLTNESDILDPNAFVVHKSNAFKCTTANAFREFPFLSELLYHSRKIWNGMSSGNVVVNHKSLNTDALKITPPEKIKGRYVSYFSSDRRPLYVQTPLIAVDSVDGDQMSLRVPSTSTFKSTLHDLETHVVDTVAKNTRDFFAGKRFSRDWIASKYHSLLSENKFNVRIAPNVLIKDQRGIDRNLSDIQPGFKIIAILHFPGLAFTKASIATEAVLVQLKVYVEESLSQWSILDDDSDPDAASAHDDDEATIDDDEVLEEISALQLSIKAEEDAGKEHHGFQDGRDDGNSLFE